jgi:hypothetical protein
MARTLTLPIALVVLAAPAATTPPTYPRSHFSELERAAVVSYWSEPGRYESRPAGEL